MINNNSFFENYSTTSGDENYGNHIGEDSFFKFFLNFKQQFIKYIKSEFEDDSIDFVTRSFRLQIHKEMHHPSAFQISLTHIYYEKLSLRLCFSLAVQENKIASAEFEIIPVNVQTRKIISKSVVYEKVKFNQYFVSSAESNFL